MQVPSELAERDQWVIWRYITRNGKTTKVPYRAKDNRKAATTRPTDWASLGDALAAAERFDAGGIGFVFTPDDPYCGIDLDHCVEGGSVHPEAQDLIKSVGGYAELSPSGTGVHLIVRAELNGHRNRTDKTPWGGNVEVYDQGRYFTFTGEALGSRQIRRGSLGQVEQLLQESPNGAAGTVGDWLAKAQKNEKFARLYEGDWSDYDSQSEADLALFNLLVHYIGPRPFSVKRAFRASELYRQDKAGGEDYLDRTLERALSESGSDKNLDRLVEERYRLKKADRLAADRLMAEEAAERPPLPLPEPGWTLEDELKQDRPPLRERIEGWQHEGQNVNLIAGYKLGKTSLTMNVMRSLADGTPFLGKFSVEQVDGRIAVWNYELIPRQWDKWAEESEIKNKDRIVPVHFRGHGMVPIWLPDVRDQVAAWMERSEVKYWIIDPTMKAWEGLLKSEGDNIGAGRFLNAIDEIKELSGIEEALLSHHTGRGEDAQERGRGATRLEDWQDVGWYLTGARDNLWLHATGRDVDVEKIRIVYRAEDARSFTTAGLTQSEAKQSEGAHGALAAVIKLENEEGKSLATRNVKDAMTGDKTKRDGWIQAAIDNGWIKREDGARGAKVCASTQLGRREFEKRSKGA